MTSEPPGIDCGDDCDESFAAGSEVELSQEAGEGSVFAGWSRGRLLGHRRPAACR